MEVLVVGRGFSGSLVSLLLADSGYDVISADPNPVIPHCTGIVSKRFVKLMGIEELVLYEPQELVLSRGKLSLRLNVPNKAAVIDRERLDMLLREASKAAGARVIKRRVKRISPNGEAVIDGTRKFRRIVDAEGAKRSLVREHLGPLETLPGVQFDVEAERDGSVLIDLSVPGLFGRIVPLGERLVRVGVATKRAHETYMRRLMRVARAKRIVSRRGGLVVLSGPKRLHRGSILLVGDAGGIPKPLTGGGLMFGLINAIVAKNNIRHPESYEREYMALMGREYFVQRLLRRLKDASRIFPRPFYLFIKAISKIAKRLDMDFRSGTRSVALSDISRIRSYLQGS